MAVTDPYKILGVDPGATEEEIKSAYRQLVKKYHPDNYAGSPLADLANEKMQEINEAYDMVMKQRRGGTSGGYDPNAQYAGNPGYSGYSGNAGYGGQTAGTGSGTSSKAPSSSSGAGWTTP